MFMPRSPGCHLRSLLVASSAAATFLCAGTAAHGQCSSFNITSAPDVAIDPGTTDIGNHCDDCLTAITLPFAVMMYGVNYTACNASSNGTLQFTTSNGEYSNQCLPQPGTLGVAICPHWDDLLTNGTGEGIFTSVSGAAPNRVFNIEWRARYYSGGGSLNFQVRLFEDNSHFEVVFGRVDQGGAGATVGVQHTSLPPTQYLCNTVGLISPGTRLSFACYNGPTGSAAATPNPVYACGTDGVALFTVNVTPGTSPPSTGITVNADLGSIGGNSSQPFYDDGTHGDATAGDRTWSFQFTVPPITPPGPKSLPFNLADAQGRSTSGAIGLTVNPCASTGPDVIVIGLTDVNYYGAVGPVSAFAIGTDACNRGDFPVLWIQGGTQHPLIAQNMYRLKNGRFEQIGQSFLKNSFQSLNSPGCATCVQPPMGGAQLGVGCSDVYGAGYNGGQGNLSPRSTCNPTTGIFTWPPPPAPPAADVIGQRLQVLTGDIDPAQNPGALYFGEAQYVTADEAQWTHAGAPSTNGLNNASYRRLSFTSATSAPTLTGPAHQMVPAIQAWKDADANVTIAVADYLDRSLPGPGIVCRFWVASNATDNGDGTWHYEYAVFNLNAARAGGSFSVPISPGVVVSNIGFHGVFAHSGEPYPNTAANPDNWPGLVVDNTVRWAPVQTYLPPAGNNGNALRWGTLYNFRFDANVPPVIGASTIGLWQPAAPSDPTSVAATVKVPDAPPVTPCTADWNHDGTLGVPDIFAFLSDWFAQVPAAMNFGGAPGVAAIFAFLSAWFAGCP